MKSVQRGVVSSIDLQDPTVVNISYVNVAKAIVILTTSGLDTSTPNMDQSYSVRLASATTLQFYGRTPGAGIAWQVIEFY